MNRPKMMADGQVWVDGRMNGRKDEWMNGKKRDEVRKKSVCYESYETPFYGPTLQRLESPW